MHMLVYVTVAPNGINYRFWGLKVVKQVSKKWAKNAMRKRKLLMTRHLTIMLPSFPQAEQPYLHVLISGTTTRSWLLELINSFMKRHALLPAYRFACLTHLLRALYPYNRLSISNSNCSLDYSLWVRIRIVWGIRMERIWLMVWLEGLVVRLGAKKNMWHWLDFRNRIALQ